MPSFNTYSRLAYAIHEWEALAYIRDWHPSHSRMAYASQEQALRPPIREWHMPFVNGGGRIREWDNSWLVRNTYLRQGKGTSNEWIALIWLSIGAPFIQLEFSI
jgi:hypothetical protein